MFQYSSQKMFIKNQNDDYINLLNVELIERQETSIVALSGDKEIWLATFETEAQAIEYMDTLLV